jgi:hypothetical protein
VSKPPETRTRNGSGPGPALSRSVYVAAALRGALMAAIFALPTALLLAFVVRRLGWLPEEGFPASLIAFGAIAVWIGDRLLRHHTPPSP